MGKPVIKELLRMVLPEGKFWTDAWSLVEGCTPVSPGCANCWLAGMYGRNLPNLTQGLINPHEKHFNGLLKLREDRLDFPLRARKPRVYAIWSDLFHDGVEDYFRSLAFQVMHKADHHHFIIITKRPHVAARYLADYPLVLKNVTILVTMEDQLRANERVPWAMKLAAMGWRVGILAEPLLGLVNLCLDIWPVPPVWILTGGESGHGARPAHPDWVRSLRDQAQAAGVPFLFKQWGEWATRNQAINPLDYCVADPFNDGVYVGRHGKKRTGRTLDGREWLEVPE